VGMLVLDRFCPAEFDQAIVYARQERIPIHEAERRLFGFDHADVGGLLAEKWGLTPTMVAGVRHHHSVIQDASHGETTAVVAAANYLASAAGMPNNSAVLSDLEPIIGMKLDVPNEQYEVIANVVSQEVQRAQQAFQIA
jgi:HD-like signal output (HDOD) protein